MEIFFYILIILIVSFLWALFSLKRTLDKGKKRRENDEERVDNRLAGEEIVLFERKVKQN